MAVLLAACGNTEQTRVKSIAQGTELTGNALESPTGSRNGGLLFAQATFAGNSGKLTMDMDLRFRIGVPTRLEESIYIWNQGDRVLRGAIREVSSTFLADNRDRPAS